MEAIHKKASRESKDRQENKRMGAFTLANVQKTQQSISKAKIEAARSMRKIQGMVDDFVKEVTQERTLIVDTQMTVLKAAEALVLKAQKSGDKAAELAAMVKIFDVVHMAMKRQKESTMALNKCVATTTRIFSEISMYDKSYRMTLTGIRNGCSSMLKQPRAFFTSMVNLTGKSQFFSDSQLHAMDIDKAIDECNRDRSLEIQQQFEEENAAAAAVVPVIVVGEEDSAFKAIHTKKDMQLVDKIATLIRAGKISQIKPEDKEKVLQWYQEYRRHLTNNISLYNSKVTQVNRELDNFMRMYEEVDDELQKLSTTLQHKPRVVIEQT